MTIWELAIKIAKGKLKFPIPLQRLIEDGQIEFGYAILPITAQHAHYAAGLPRHHDDPFDRMVIAQAHVEGLQLISKDSHLSNYGVPLVW